MSRPFSLLASGGLSGSWGFHNKEPQAQGPETTEMHFLIVLGARCLRSRSETEASAGLVASEAVRESLSQAAPGSSHLPSVPRRPLFIP